MSRAGAAALAILALLWTILPAAAQRQPLPKLAKDSPYATARMKLLSLGFRPERLPDADACEKDDPRCFPETFACAGTGLGQCVYVWRSGETLIEVRSIGEIPVVDTVRCRANCR